MDNDPKQTRMRTNRFSKMAKKFVRSCHKIRLDTDAKTVSLDPILETLSGFRKNDEYVYEALITGETGLGGASLPYARLKELEPLQKVFGDFVPEINQGKNSLIGDEWTEGLDFDYSPEGAWAVILLTDIASQLPLFWHANYDSITYILDDDKYADIVHIREFLTPDGQLPDNYHELVDDIFKEGEERYFYAYPTREDLVKALELHRENKLPSVSMNEDGSFDIKYYVWNEWNGLHRAVYHAKKDKKGKLSLTPTKESADVFRYNCGICY